MLNMRATAYSETRRTDHALSGNPGWPRSSVHRPRKLLQTRALLRTLLQGADAGLDNTRCPVLPTFTGKVSIRGKPEYDSVVGQYASLNHEDDNSMKPYAIIEAAGDEDIMQALTWARKNHVKVAVRTGGHQYSGASSTTGCNIQLDVSHTYRDINWLDKNTVEFGISRKLIDLNQELRDHDSFVPHGQCAHVHVGGHSHSGGYGLPGRAFGLFGDHIIAIRVITADGPNGTCTPPRWIERDTTDPKEAELFWAVLGGSPGNFAVLTKIRLRVNSGADHPKARGIKLIGIYSPLVMKRLLTLKAEMAADQNLPADFDYCVTVMSGGLGSVPDEPQPIIPAKDFVLDPEAEDKSEPIPALQTEHSVVEKYGKGGGKALQNYLQTAEGKEAVRHFQEALGADVPAELVRLVKSDLNRFKAEGLGDLVYLPVIVVFAEWANLEGADQDDAAAIDWLKRIKDTNIGIVTGKHLWLPPIPDISGEWGPDDKEHGMPFMTSKWVFPIQREYKLPYDKRTFVTNATNLNTSGWVDFTLGQVNDLCLNWLKYFYGCRLALQIQHYGGTHSRFRTKGEDGKTSYSWRDSTVLLTMDVFYFPFGIAKELARLWQKKNDETYKGPKGNFSPGMDRRVFWGSYEAQDKPDENNLGKYWRFYHEDETKWKKLREIKGRLDPDNVLSPNPFAVPPL